MRIKFNIKYSLAASIALLTFLVYLPALRNEFVYWDDNRYIFENPDIRSFDAAFFRWAFFSFHVSNWHPLTWISHALDYSLWGMNPLGHHLTNIILHAINTALVVLLALKLLEIVRVRSTQNGPASFLNDRTIMIAAGVTGLLFGIHPVHVESVAWVSERKDLLCALFFLLSIMMYVNAVMRREQRAEGVEKRAWSMGHRAEAGGLTPCAMRYALFFFTLALLSKPMAVTLPVVLLILDWYPFGRIRSWKTMWLTGFEKLPLVALSAASAVITIMAQKAGGALSSIDKVPLSIRVPVAAKALIAYLGRMLLPVNLLPFYPYPKDVSLFSFESFLTIGLVVGVTVACVLLVKKQKLWLAAWGYYVVTLIPVLGIVQVGGQSMADRYMYLPSLGPFLVAGLCAAWISERVPAVKGPVLLTKSFSALIAVLLVIVLSYKSIDQIALWKNSIDLWTYVIEKEPERVPIAYNNRGLTYYKSGQFDRAVADFHKAVILRPSYIDAYSNLGMAFFKIGRLDEAIANFDEAIALDPAYYKAYNNRAIVLGAMGKFDEATQDYNKVIALKPSSPQAYYNLGILHAQAGFFDQAIKYFSQSLAVDPGYVDAYSRRGMLYFQTGRRELASADFQKACELGDKRACDVLHQLTQGLP